VTYALVGDIAASWERYAGLVRLLRHAPSGLLLHVAGPTDEGFRIIEVWESEDAWRRFEPDLQAAIAAIDEDVRPRVAVRDLHGEHEILSQTWAHVVTPATAALDDTR
jgi:hypothetical protein